MADTLKSGCRTGAVGAADRHPTKFDKPGTYDASDYSRGPGFNTPYPWIFHRQGKACKHWKKRQVRLDLDRHCDLYLKARRRGAPPGHVEGLPLGRRPARSFQCFISVVKHSMLFVVVVMTQPSNCGNSPIAVRTSTHCPVARRDIFQINLTYFINPIACDIDVILTIRRILIGLMRRGKPNARVSATMLNTTDFVAEDFLASTADLVSVLASFADSGRRWSAQHRGDSQLVRTALSRLLPGPPSIGQSQPAVRPIAPAPQRTVAERGSLSCGGQAPVVLKGARSGGGRRHRCQCGQCKWCLDNARWDRIYNDKFADPGYYGRIAIRHNSTLAEPR